MNLPRSWLLAGADFDTPSYEPGKPIRGAVPRPGAVGHDENKGGLLAKDIARLDADLEAAGLRCRRCGGRTAKAQAMRDRPIPGYSCCCSDLVHVHLHNRLCPTCWGWLGREVSDGGCRGHGKGSPIPEIRRFEGDTPIVRPSSAGRLDEVELEAFVRHVSNGRLTRRVRPEENRLAAALPPKYACGNEARIGDVVASDPDGNFPWRVVSVGAGPDGLALECLYSPWSRGRPGPAEAGKRYDTNRLVQRAGCIYSCNLVLCDGHDFDCPESDGP